MAFDEREKPSSCQLFIRLSTRNGTPSGDMDVVLMIFVITSKDLVWSKLSKLYAAKLASKFCNVILWSRW